MAIRWSVRLLFVLFMLGMVYLSVEHGYSAETCLNCHTNPLERPFKHPGALDGCTTCHKTHNEVDFNDAHYPNLIDSVNQVCLNCHKDPTTPGECFNPNADGTCGHPVVGHPVLGKVDPIDGRKPFNCASCHNPHSSSQPKLFRYDYSETTVYQGNLCAVCHTEQFGIPKPKFPPLWSGN